MEEELTAWLVDEVESGDRRRALEVTRRKLAQLLALSVGREGASLSRELREVMRELEGLPDAEEVSAVDSIIDEVAEARERRAAGR